MLKSLAVKGSGIAAILLTSAFGAVPQVAAGPIDSSQPSSVRITFDDPIFTNGWRDIVTLDLAGEFSGERVYAGRFSGDASELVNVTEDTFVDGVDNVFMYCFDLLQSISSGASVSYGIEFSPVDIERTLSFIGAVNTVLNTRRGTAGADFDPYAWARPASRSESVAIQLGLWESRYETEDTWSLGSGDFRASGLFNGVAGDGNGADDELAGFFEQVVSTSNLSVDAALVMLLKNDSRQDMITPDPPAVPAPASLGLLGLGLALLRRRGQRRVA